MSQSAVEVLDPTKLSSADINQLTEDELHQLMSSRPDELFKLDNSGQRFDLHPAYRIPVVMGLTGMIGGMNGLFDGYSRASLQYLAANSHRLPTTQNGWFYYHKRKNYVCMQKSIQSGAKAGTRMALIFGAVFGMEAALDSLRNCIDFANTAMSLGTMGFCYAVYHDFTRVQTKIIMRKGFAIGAVIGLVQDGLQLLKGDDVWYMREFFGILPRDKKRSTS